MRPAHTTGCSPQTSAWSASSSSASARRGPVARSRTSVTGRADGDMAGCFEAIRLIRVRRGMVGSVQSVYEAEEKRKRSERRSGPECTVRQIPCCIATSLPGGNFP
ncbi:hypothetical protein ACFFX0_13580 [Citricoccus parietis]|uniref:Uncharacterized protein n=1 Tax=Citricoccus parietis TaxID=592307 RepID=A0ABV5G0Z5_9MICC